MGLKQADTTCDVVDGWARLVCGEVVLYKVDAGKLSNLPLNRVHDILWAGYIGRSKTNDDNLLRSLRIAPLNVEADAKAETR